ncbi:LamG domain-containing protein [Candidatus Thorarchaeota archaeon]|nr:MAG: LamG domain-containing protein [Candidatus Thorarchaeota archaeon]
MVLRGLFMSTNRLFFVLSLLLLATIPFTNINAAAGQQTSISSVEEPVSWWEFNEGEGVTVVDSQDNGNDGTMIGCERVEGIVDGALDFDGDNDYVEFDASGSIESIETEFTIEALVRLHSYGTQNGNTLFMMSTSTPTSGGHENILGIWASNIPQDNVVTAAFYDSEGDYNIATFDYVLNLDTWTMVTVVGQTDGTLSLYIDGTLMDETFWDSPLIIDQLHKYYTGTDIDGDGSKTDFLDGTLDDLKVYNEAISAYQVQQNYYALLDVEPEPLVAEWNFNEGEGYSLGDHSGNSNDGDIHGADWASGLYSGALYFDGDGDYVDINPSSSFQSMTFSFTVEALVQLDSYGRENGNGLFMMSAPTPIESGHENVLSIWASNIPQDNKTTVVMYDTSGTRQVVVFDYTIGLGQWVVLHVVGDYTGSMRLYINGTQVGALSWNPPLTENLYRVYLGTDIDADGTRTDFFHGTMDHMRIYNVVLSSTEIAESYESLVSTESTTTSTFTTTGNNTTQGGFNWSDFLTYGVTIGSVVVIVIVASAIICNRRSGSAVSSSYYGA